MFEKIIIFLTEKKLILEDKKQGIKNKMDDASWFLHEKKADMRAFYNKNLKTSVDKIKKYLDNLYEDYYDSQEVLYDNIWYHTQGRVLGYIMSAILSFVILMIIGLVVMVTKSSHMALLFSLIPVSIIPIDIITTMSLFVSKRIKRAYNNKLNKMKRKYGVRNNKDLIEKYKEQKSQEKVQEESKKQEQKVTKEETKQETKEEIPVKKEQELTDSAFLEQMLGYVSNSRYISEEERKRFLDEINYILNKYTSLKRSNTSLEVNGYLKSDVEHLQNEYNRYLRNTQKEEINNTRSYPVRIMKK